MARTLTDEDIRLNLIINGNAAQKELHELDEATRTLRRNSASLREEKQRLERANQRESEEYRRVTAELRSNSAAVRANEARMEALRQEIGLTSLTMNQLAQRARVLRLSLANAIPGSEAFNRFEAELNAINARMSELRAGATATRFSIGNLADGFNRYAALGASVLATFTGVVLSAQKVIDINGKLTDSQSDVMKTTGMTQKEVDELTKSFGAFNTRSTRMELLGLATEAGRLGITGVENVRAFVEQANKMKVALGDDLSDEAIREVGKMVNVYKVGEETGKDFAGSMDALGSAINEVSASGANQAGFLVDYLKRMAGIAPQAKLSAADNLAYAATFDEVGQSVEVSATAMNKVWMDMMSNPSDYAKIAGMSIKNFQKLLGEDSNEAMIKFLDGLNGNNQGMSVMLEKLKDLDVGGARGVQALSALAANTDLLRKRQQTSNEALIEATSLTNEYTIKNENLAAIVEKTQKKILGLFTSETVVNWLTNTFKWFGKFIGAVEDADGSVEGFRNRLVFLLKVLTIIVVSYFSYQTAIRLTTIWTKSLTVATQIYTAIANRGAVATGLLRSAKLLLAYAAALATGKLGRASAAMRLFNATVKANPLGLLLSALFAVGTALYLFRKNTSDIAKIQENANAIHNESVRLIGKEKRELELLEQIAKSHNATKEQKIRAINRMNEIIPDYIGHLTLENIKTAEGTEILKKATAELYKNARAKAAAAKYDQLVSEKMDIESKTSKDYESWVDKSMNFVFGETNAIKDRNEVRKIVSDLLISQGRFTTNKETGAKLLDKKLFDKLVNDMMAQTGLLDKEKELASKEAEIKALESEVVKNVVDGIKINPDVVDTVLPTDLPSSKGDDKAKQAREKRIEDLKRLAEERIKIEREAEDAILANMDEGNQKRWQLEQTEYTRKIQDLQARLVSETEIEKALTASKNKALSKEQRDFHAQQAKYWIDNNKHVYSLIESAEATHQLKLETIREQAALDRLKMIDDAYSLERLAKEKVFLQQLNDDKVFGEQRQKALEAFKAEQDEREAEMLRHKIAELQRIMQGEKIEGVDFSLLTDEQLNKLDADLVEMMKRLSELSDAKNKLTQSDLQGLGLNTKTDILGFSPDNWAYFFQNLKDGKFGIEQMAFAVQGLTNMYAQFAEFQTASGNANLKSFEKNTDARKRGLKKQLDNGYISQAEYNRKIEETDALLDRKKAELEYKQAKRARLIASANIINNTAQAIIGIWAEVPKADFGISAGVLTGFVSALGALQLATVLKTPLPAKGYETGLYPEYIKREQDGKTFKASYGGKTKSGMVNKPTYFLAGENSKPEMIIDNKAFSQLSDQTRNALIMELRGIKGFENGFYSEKSQRIEIPNAPPSAPVQDPNSAMMLSVMVRLTDVLEKIESDGVLAKVLANDYKSMRHLREGLKNYENLKEKNKN